MVKTNTYRKYISLAMLLVFFSPILIKTIHFLYVHHDHDTDHLSHQKHITKQHKQCPICSFEFVEFINNNKVQIDTVPELILDLYTYTVQSVYIQNFFYSFNLRAPPFCYLIINT